MPGRNLSLSLSTCTRYLRLRILCSTTSAARHHTTDSNLHARHCAPCKPRVYGRNKPSAWRKLELLRNLGAQGGGGGGALLMSECEAKRDAARVKRRDICETGGGLHIPRRFIQKLRRRRTAFNVARQYCWLYVEIDV